MFYQKFDTLILIGNSAIPADLRVTYKLTLCFSLTHRAFFETQLSEYNFFDISFTHEQLKDLHSKLSFHLDRLDRID